MSVLQLSYDSEEQVPEGLGEFYEENDDGNFVIQVEGMKTQEDVDRVMGAMEKQKELRIEAEKNLAKFPEDFDAERWAKVKNLDPDKIPDASKINEKVTEAENRWKEKLAESERNATEMEAKFKKSFIEMNLKDGLLAVGVDNKIRLEDAVNRIQQRHDVELVEENGRFTVVAGNLREGLEEFLKDWAASEEGKFYVTARMNEGGGADSGSGNTGGELPNVNPYADETLNITEQARLETEQPQVAKRLAEKAGVSLELVD